MEHSRRPYWGMNRRPSAQCLEPSIDESPARDVWCAEASSGDLGDDRWNLFRGDLEALRGFQAQYRSHGYAFDIVRVRQCQDPGAAAEETSREGFMGFDVATFVLDSMIYAFILQVPMEFQLESLHTREPSQLDPVFRIIERYFGARLNACGLFDKYDDACELRDAIEGVQSVAPQEVVPNWEETQVFALSQMR